MIEKPMKTMKTPRNIKQGRSRQDDAFSLVEVTIALAIAALGFITLLGLLPQGMEMARQSSELSSYARIIQKVSGELQTEPWTDLTWTGYGGKRYFTDEGVELQSSELNAKNVTEGLTYVAAVYVPSSQLDVKLPGSTQAQNVEPYTRRVWVAVATTTNKDFDFTNAPKSRVLSRSVLLAKTNN